MNLHNEGEIYRPTSEAIVVASFSDIYSNLKFV